MNQGCPFSFRQFMEDRLFKQQISHNPVFSSRRSEPLILDNNKSNFHQPFRISDLDIDSHRSHSNPKNNRFRHFIKGFSSQKLPSVNQKFKKIDLSISPKNGESKFPLITQKQLQHENSLKKIHSDRFIYLPSFEDSVISSPKKNQMEKSPSYIRSRRRIILNEQLIQITQNRQKMETFKSNNKTELMNQKQIIAEFLKQKFTAKNQNQFKEKQKLLGIARLDLQANIFFDRITHDQLLIDIFAQLQNKESLKNVHKRVLGMSFDNTFLIQTDRLIEAHKNLGIRNKHFNRMKYYYLTSMMEMNTPVDTLFRVIQTIESFRFPVLGKLPIFQQFGGLEGVNKVATVMYSKIFSDYILGIFFKDIDLDTQAYKFARLFSQILNTNDSPNYSLEVLRERHVKYGLTYIHFAYFKMYLSQALYELNVSLKKIAMVLSILDGYKCSVINLDAIYDLILRSYASLDDFLNEYFNLCKTDQLIAPLIIKRTNERFMKHIKNVFYYLFNRQMSAITFKDLISVHEGKSIISPEIFDAFSSKAFYLVKRLKPETIVFRDFEEEWDQVKILLLDKFPYEKAGGWERIEKLCQIVTSVISQQSSIMGILNVELLLFLINQDYEVKPGIKVRRTFNFIGCGIRYYKKTDIQTIHGRLKISQAVFDNFMDVNKFFIADFIKALRISIQQFDPSLLWLLDLFEIYRPYIVSY